MEDSIRFNKPSWLKAKLPTSPGFKDIKNIVDQNNLHTVCESAQCPNLGECWSRGTATFMILGNICTRSCTFCAIQTGRPTEIDLGEPLRVANAVKKMKLNYVVITSVARDDIKGADPKEDGGASIWAATIRAIRHKNPHTVIEVLIPDFRGQEAPLYNVLDAKPDVLNHNLETVERLQRPIRKTANYKRSLEVLQRAKSKGFVTKSGIMLGIGEEQHEIPQVISDIRSAGCDILTIGQYLQPSNDHTPLHRWVTPDEFNHWKSFALSLGFGAVESGPLVRSSYHADEQGKTFQLGIYASQPTSTSP